MGARDAQGEAAEEDILRPEFGDFWASSGSLSWADDDCMEVYKAHERDVA